MNVASDSIDDQSNWGNVEEEVDWGIHDSCKDFLVDILSDISLFVILDQAIDSLVDH